MVRIHTVFASAGCGKTEFCTSLAADFIARRVCSRDQILYTTFQKTAAADAARRAGITGEAARGLWYRTLHSACLKLLRIPKGNIITPSKMAKFGERMGVEIASDMGVEDDEEADLAQAMLALQRVRTLSEDSGAIISKLIATYQLSRLTSRSVEELRATRHEPSAYAMRYFGNVDSETYSNVVESYETWKGGQLIDFVDMLEKVILEPVTLPKWKKVFVDESQDLCPLQHQVLKRFSEGAEDIFYAGDDWQSIMGFQGATADGFLSLRSNARKIHLPQTHRFGQSIIDLGTQIASRLPEGEPKTILPMPGKRNPIRRIFDLEEASDYPGSKFYLHRHREGCNAIARKLITEGKPFWCERGVNPLGKATSIAGYLAIKKLMRMEVLDGIDMKSLLGVIGASKDIRGDRVKLMKRGSHTLLKRMDPTQTITPLELSAHFTEILWDRLRAEDWSLTDVTFADYYKSLEDGGFELGSGKEPEITISTVHGSKGRDAESVFVWDEILPKCMTDPGEHRVGYVAVTRTKGPLYIVSSPVTTWNMTTYPFLPDGVDALGQ